MYVCIEKALAIGVHFYITPKFLSSHLIIMASSKQRNQKDRDTKSKTVTEEKEEKTEETTTTKLYTPEDALKLQKAKEEKASQSKEKSKSNDNGEEKEVDGDEEEKSDKKDNDIELNPDDLRIYQQRQKYKRAVWEIAFLRCLRFLVVIVCITIYFIFMERTHGTRTFEWGSLTNDIVSKKMFGNNNNEKIDLINDDSVDEIQKPEKRKFKIGLPKLWKKKDDEL